MFQSVTYTGFEKHPERRAWVEGVVMPFVNDVFRDEATTMSVHWHDANFEQVFAWELPDIVRRDVLPGLGDHPLVGDFFGENPDRGHTSVNIPGVLFAVRSRRLPAGWAYVPVPTPGDEPHPFFVEWIVRRTYLKMLDESVRKIVAGFESQLTTAGV